MTKKFVDTMHNEGSLVHPYTVNDGVKIRHLKALGVNGIFTDRPDVAFRIKKEKSNMY